VDVLADGHALLFVRARSCDLRHGRWLQRDPEGYIDGPNLYEAFGGNAVANTDPEGTGIITWLMGLGWEASDAEFLGNAGRAIHEQNVVPMQARAKERFLLLYTARQSGDPCVTGDVGVFLGGLLLAVGDALPSGLMAESATGISTGRFEQAGSGLGGGTRVLRAAVATGETALWGLFSTRGGQAAQGLLARSGAVQAAEVRFFQATGGRMRLGLLSEGGFLTAAGANAGLSGLARQEALILVFGQGLESGIAQYGLATAGAARLGAAEVLLPVAGAHPRRLAVNIAAGQAQEAAARAWAAAQGETLLRTQFRQGAVVRGIDFASFVRTPEGGVNLFLNEVSSTQGLRAPGSFTALGMGRGGQPVFRQNLRKVQKAILTQVPPGPLQQALLSQPGTVRLLGPSGFGVTLQGLTRIQATTNRPVVVLIVPSGAP